MLAIKYSIFAIISTLFNLAFQYITNYLYGGFGALYLAIFVGTLAGLIPKYILDKKYIFYHQTKDKRDDIKKFGLYTMMSIFTTIIFWGTEITFDIIFDNENAKYLGAVVGLSVGYVVKYFLDKRYVFIDEG
jgi:peptidoglycan biosynthesis protein MviN/MurJ (putative lipid II flippase)